jgi:succinate dehydrogenase flavin-adding protein (antitoxin of CptAB toxin-antitoxin module)
MIQKKENKIFYQARRKINQGIMLDDVYLNKKMGQDLSASSDTVSDEEIKTMKNLLDESDEEFDINSENIELNHQDLEILKLDLNLEN